MEDVGSRWVEHSQDIGVKIRESTKSPKQLLISEGTHLDSCSQTVSVVIATYVPNMLLFLNNRSLNGPSDDDDDDVVVVVVVVVVVLTFFFSWCVHMRGLGCPSQYIMVTG